MWNGYPYLARELGANPVHLESRYEAYDGVGHPSADGSYGVTFCGFGVGKPVETPANTLDLLIRLKLSKPVVGYPQLLQLAWTKEVAYAGSVKNILIEFRSHGLSFMSALFVTMPTFYKTAMTNVNIKSASPNIDIPAEDVN